MNNEQNYTEQPFNLETALKHPEWVYFRNGEKPLEWHWFEKATRNSEICSININGDMCLHLSDGSMAFVTTSHDYDLILRVPYKEVWVVFYEGSDAYWYKTKEEALENTGSNRLACVPVKIPAVC